MSKALVATNYAEVKDLLSSMKMSIADALPRHLSPDRMSRIVFTQTRLIPKLLKTTRESFAGAIITASQLGLEPGINGQCWILPYGNVATFIIGYQGLIELAYRSGLLTYITGESVHENDFFEYGLGTENYIKHRRAEGPKGKLIYSYAVAQVKGSSEKIFKVVDAEEIKKIKSSSQSANSEYSPWAKWPEEMWVKTAVKKLMKFLPKSAEMNIAIEKDNMADAIDVDFTTKPEYDPLSEGEHDVKKEDSKVAVEELSVEALFEQDPANMQVAMERMGVSNLPSGTSSKKKLVGIYKDILNGK